MATWSGKAASLPPIIVWPAWKSGWRRATRSCIEQWKQYDWQFHQALISACGSPMLVETHAAVFDKYLRYQMLALSYRGEIAAREHALPCSTARSRRDAAAAGDVLSRHVGGGVEHALATGTLR